MNTPRSKPLALLACLFAGGLCFAHPVLNYSVSRQTLSAAGSAAKAGGEKYELSATLGHGYLAVDQQGKRTIYDFERRRIFRLDVARRTYREESLYAVIGFRVTEIRNRMMLASAFTAAKVKETPFVAAQIEHLLSLTSDSEHTVVDRGGDRTDEVFSWKGAELMRVSRESRPLPAAYQPELWRFMRYEMSGHPAIYAALSGRAGVPAKTAIVLLNPDRTLRTWVLRSIEIKPDAPYSLLGFTRARGAAGELEPAVVQLGADAPAQMAVRAAKARQDRDSALAQGRVLEAMLAHFDAGIASGDLDGNWIESQKGRLAADAAARTLTESLSPHSEKDANDDVRALQALESRRPAYGHILSVFRGNIVAQLNRPEEAQRLFLSALRTNPFLAGTWHDLGDSYFRQFKAQEAWVCWDAARRIAPDHPMLKQANEFEQTLLAHHPEFF